MYLFTKIHEALVFKHGYCASVAVMASTGMAAAGIHGGYVCFLPLPSITALSGQTLHSWAGFNNPFITINKAVEKANRHLATYHQWIETNALLIDKCKLFISHAGAT